MTAAPLLAVSGLKVTFDGYPIVSGLNLTIRRGEAVGLAGESGSGKTTTALSLVRLLPASLRHESGEIVLRIDDDDEAINVHRRTDRGMELVRGRGIGIVFQGAMNALDPVWRIDRQLAEAITAHEPDVPPEEIDERVRWLLNRVGIGAERLHAYPHQLSGGQRQRLTIALALAARPALIIADEPTTALDVMIQAQVLDLLAELRRELGVALLLISHDLSVIAQACDRVAVMYAGRIIESGPVDEVLHNPQHPYTRGLVSAMPRIGDRHGIGASIPGEPPDPTNPDFGCCFAPRCRHAQQLCDDAPTLRSLSAEHSVACHFAPWTTSSDGRARSVR
jgi:peptide/nickel transport system ATP-binding protein